MVGIAWEGENADLLACLGTEVEDCDLASPAYDNLFHAAEAEGETTDCGRSTPAEGGGQNHAHRASLWSVRGRGCRAGAAAAEGKPVLKWRRGQRRQGQRWMAFCYWCRRWCFRPPDCRDFPQGRLKLRPSSFQMFAAEP